MTPRDQYAAAALQGLLASNSDMDWGKAAEWASNHAEAMVEEACERWDHLWNDDGTECCRCGKTLSETRE